MSNCISWDIGIKNLAYCSLDSNNSNSTCNTIIFNNKNYDITYWADISLVNQIETNMESSGEVSHINNTLKCSALNETANKKANKKDKKNSKMNSKQSETQSETQSEIQSEIQSENDSIEQIVCGKTAMYCREETTIDSSGTIKYNGLCKTHFKKSGEERMPELSVKQCWDKECSGKPIQVLKAHIYKGYCKKHINDLIKTKIHTTNDFLKINRAKTTSKFDINQLGIALFQELDKIKHTILDASIILLENQPVLKNPTMKSMQMFLYSYYLIRIIDSNTDTNNTNSNSVSINNSNTESILNNKKIQCYCASKKLDLIKFLSDTEQKRIMDYIDTVNSGYQKNKKMAIMMVESILKNNDKWLAFFKGHPKKDDLADSLLMSLHYFEKTNLVKLKKDEEKTKTKIIKDTNKIIKDKIIKDKNKKSNKLEDDNDNKLEDDNEYEDDGENYKIELKKK